MKFSYEVFEFGQATEEERKWIPNLEGGHFRWETIVSGLPSQLLFTSKLNFLCISLGKEQRF